ncbi:MAG: Flp pilus assembly protein CpaB [Rhodospirillales bacterium CG15_BIG_FIL_POST_REV_8_21_14_020_66_15]|nr:MAG: Flp pilus assembly protein CpaB [Rhodospirillales bacterium CG15_BIG_FIL_POST_REV_8_21_14_020_66_15]
MPIMSIRGILLIVVALTAAAGTALFARNWLAQQQAAFKARPVQAVQATDTARVLVAKETMEAGRFVRAEDLRWAAWPKAGVSEGYVVEGVAPKGVKPVHGDDEGGNAKKPGKAVFDGAVVRSRITAGEPVTALKLVQPGERGFLSAVLEPGKRAVSVPVDATTGIAGFIFPGDWVDVIFIGQMRFESQRGGADGNKMKKVDFSETLLSEVRVIAIDQKVENGDGQAKVAKTATLQVTPKQAEKIALALKMGGVSLSLHSLARHEETGGDRFTEVARAVGAMAPDTAGSRDLTGSYTLEFDIMSMLGDKRFRRGHGGGGVHVLRADKAEQATF